MAEGYSIPAETVVRSGAFVHDVIDSTFSLINSRERTLDLFHRMINPSATESKGFVRRKYSPHSFEFGEKKALRFNGSKRKSLVSIDYVPTRGWIQAENPRQCFVMKQASFVCVTQGLQK